jgi:putative methionine-R-sulfoxide reductase with GAF domain
MPVKCWSWIELEWRSNMNELNLKTAVESVKAISSRFDWVGIYLLKGKVLELGPYIGTHTDHSRIPVGTGVCGRAVFENQDLNIPNVHLEENYLACSLETQSELVVLIRDSQGRILGQIDIDSRTRDAFGAEEERKVKEIANQLGKSWLDS